MRGSAAAEAAGTNAGAMIAYVGLNTGEAAYHYYRGLAIALADCPPTNNEDDTGYKYKSQLKDPGHTRISKSNPFPAESGIQYIAKHTAEYEFDTQYPAFSSAFYPPIYGSYCPEWCSNWFLGTGYQWQQMINNTGGFASFGELRAAIIAAGGTDLAETFNNSEGTQAKYWTSSQASSSAKAWYFTVVGGGSFGNDWVTTAYKVRPIVAF